MASCHDLHIHRSFSVHQQLSVVKFYAVHFSYWPMKWLWPAGSIKASTSNINRWFASFSIRYLAISCKSLPNLSNFNDFTAWILQAKAPSSLFFHLFLDCHYPSAFCIIGVCILALPLTSLLLSETNEMNNGNVSQFIHSFICLFPSSLFVQRLAWEDTSHLIWNNLL